MQSKTKTTEPMCVATIDEALETTNFGKFNYFIIIFTGVASINVVLESVGISFVLPVLDCDLHLTFQQQGVLGAVAFLGIIVTSHFWGFMADTTGRKKIMRPALLLQFLVTVISSFSPNFESLVFFRFLNGVLLSASSATIWPYLGEFHCNKYRNRAILSGAFISAIAAICFPLIAWIFINQSWELYVPFVDLIFRPWRSYLIACGVPGFVCGLLLFYLPESPKFLLTKGRQNEAIDVIKWIHKLNNKKQQDYKEFNYTDLLPDLNEEIKKASLTNYKNPVTAIMHSVWDQTAPLFMREHIKKTFLTSFIQFTIFFTAHGVYMWFPYILNTTMQYTQRDDAIPMRLCDIVKFMQPLSNTSALDEPTACLTHLEISTYQHTIMLEIVYVCLLLIVSYAIGKLGRKPILFIVLLVCGLCGILALWIKIPLVAIYFFLILLSCGLGTTVVNAIVVDIYPTNLRAMAICISLMLGRIGSVVGSNLFGIFINTNCEAALYSSAGALILSGVLGYFLPRSNDQKPPINRI